MFTRRNHSIMMISLLLLVGTILIVQPVVGKSAYLSANHHTKQFDAWNIGSTGLISKQATYWLSHATDPAGIGIDGATGVGNDPLMFVTTEGTGGIEVINPVTLTFHGVAPGPVNMGGVDVDDIDNIVYSIQRGTSSWGGNGTSNLYIYTYNDDGTGITQLANITLPNHGYGMSLALDDSRDILWVCDYQYSMVRAYDVNVSGVWTNIAEIPSLSFSVSHQPVDVTVDSRRNIVYTVSYNSSLLSKYDVDAEIETTVTMSHPGMGIAVDEESGYIYMTHGFGGDYLQVWDCSITPFSSLQTTAPVGNPAGIAIANVSFNPLNLAKNNEIQGEGIWVNQTFTYEIICDNLDNTVDATGVKIRDDMPIELDYISETVDGVSGTGVYDPIAHTVFWDIGTILAGEAGPLVELVVRVNNNAVLGTTIYNKANIWADVIDTTTVTPQPPCDTCGSPGDSIITPPFGDVIGQVYADCPVPGTGLLGVEVDVYDTLGNLVANAVTDVNGYYEVLELEANDYTIIVVTPLGFQASPDEQAITVLGADTVIVDFALTCMEITASPRTIGFWKHQVGVATGGKGNAQIDASTLCDYLDLIEGHFNGNAINQVIVYQPSVSDSCADKLQVLKALLNLKGSVDMIDRAKQQLMALLLNVAGGKISQTEIISADGATVSQAITYSDNVIDDPAGDYETAKTICDEINNNREVAAGIIPLSTANIAYRQGGNSVTYALSQNYPNPFNPTTTIGFSVEEQSDYKLTIYNVTGQMVRQFFGVARVGDNSVVWDASSSGSGVYFYRLETEVFTDSKKMILLK